MEKRDLMADDVASEQAFDWAYARERIAEVRARLVAEEEQRPEVLQEVWAERAAKEAKRVVEEAGTEQIELIVVRLGQELYGLNAHYVFRIDDVGHITEVPHVPAWVAGVTNVRGRILSAFDLRRFLGLSQGNGRSFDNMPNDKASRDAELPYLVLVETPEMELALLVQEVLTVTSVPVDMIRDTSDTIRGIPPEYVWGVIEDLTGNADLALTELDVNQKDAMLVVLDLQALLADERLIIQEEVA
jgi:purine-binding chemotaxis protein CheW